MRITEGAGSAWAREKLNEADNKTSRSSRKDFHIVMSIILLLQHAQDALLQGIEGGIGAPARAFDIDRELRADASGPPRHHHHPVAQINRFIHVMSDKDHVDML